MNAKLAKRLRKAARNATTTLPGRAYETQDDINHARPNSTVVAVVNKYESTRGLYRDLKKEARLLT